MKTSITIDEVLWQRVKVAAESWARRENLPASGMASKWIAKQLKEAVDREGTKQ
jgi:hypothetical protein